MPESARQEEWVAVQRYDVAPWAELLSLWRSYNRHIAWVVGAMPEAELRKARPRDTLDPNAWGAVLAHDPITLEHFVIDQLVRGSRHGMFGPLAEQMPVNGAAGGSARHDLVQRLAHAAHVRRVQAAGVDGNMQRPIRH